jgi:hypothetical protein
MRSARVAAILATALAQYQRGRQPVGSARVARGQRLGAYIDTQRRPKEGLAAILREWGAAGVIDGATIDTASA